MVFAPRGKVPDTTHRERTKYKVQVGICVWHLWPKTPQTNSEKKRKTKHPERFPAGRERSTHTTNPDLDLYLYF